MLCRVAHSPTAKRVYAAYVRVLKTVLSENNMETFLSSLSRPVNRKIALVDVHYSNSLIEAHNKIIKYNYLYRMDIPHGEHLRKIFPSIVENFNNRPHVSLAGLTPNEAEQNLSLNKEQLRIYTAKAAREREMYNRINQCSHCKD